MPTAKDKYLIVRFSILPVTVYQPTLYRHAGLSVPGIVQRRTPVRKVRLSIPRFNYVHGREMSQTHDTCAQR